MKATFLILSGILIIAEILPSVWFSGAGRELAFLRANEKVKRTSLVEERSADLLGFDNGVIYSSDRGGDVSITVLTWNAENSHGLMDAFGHSPEVCLPVSGAQLLATFPARELSLESGEFMVHGWMFSHPLFDERIHAFKLAHSAYPRLPEMALNKELAKVRLLLLHERRQMPPIEIAIGIVHGTNHPDVAWERFEDFARKTFCSEIPTQKDQ